MKETYEERQAREAREREVFNAQLATVIHDLPTLLGEGWSAKFVEQVYERSPRIARVQHSDGRSFTVGCVGYDQVDRFAVSGDYPRDSQGNTHFPYGTNRPEITVKASRPVAALAQAIQSRFLPEYNPLFAEMVKVNQQHDDYLNKQTALHSRMTALTGAKNPRHHVGSGTTFYVGNDYHEFQVTSEKVDLRLHGLSPELAEQIVNLVKGA